LITLIIKELFKQLQHSFLKFVFPSIWRMSSKYSMKQHTFAQLHSKQMSKIYYKIIPPHFWDIVIVVLGYFVLTHPVYHNTLFWSTAIATNITTILH